MARPIDFQRTPISIPTINTRIGDTIYIGLMALTLVGYPLVSVLPELTGLPTRDFSVPYRAVFLVLCLVSTVISLYERALHFRGKFWAFFAVFWVMYVVRLLNDTVLSVNPLGFDVGDYWLFTVGVTVIPAVAFARVTNVPTLERSARWSAVLLFASVGLNMWVGWDKLGDATSYIRFGTESINPIAVGTIASRLFLICMFIVLSPLLFVDRRKSHRMPIVLSIAAMPLGAVALLFSGSRGPVVATLAGAAILLWLLFRWSENRVVLPVALALLVLSIVAVALPFVVNLGGGVLERFYSTSHLEDMSDVDRFNLWRNGWEQFLENPLFGSGVEELEYHFYPHNLVLEGYMATGIVGGTIFTGLAAYSLYVALKLIRSRTRAIWLSLLYVNAWFIALFSGSIWGAASLIHLMIAVVVTEQSLRPRLSA